MLSHSVEICKRRDANIYKTSEGVSTWPLALYSYKKPSAGAQKWETILVYRRPNTRIYVKVKRLQEETPKRDTQSASPDIIAARRKASPGRTTRKRDGKSPEPFRPSWKHLHFEIYKESGQSSPGGGSGSGGINVNKTAEFGSRLW